jgi:hypothetical protein
MSNDAAIANLMGDIGPTIERADPAVARAALAHLFAAAVVRPVDADVEHLNPHLVAAINAFRRSATRQRKHPESSLIEAAQRAARKDYGRRL